MKRSAWLIAVLAALALAAPAFGQSSTPAVTTNRSAVITTGNTFQTVIAALPGGGPRRSLTIQNNNSSDNCWIYVGGSTATKATAILLLPGGSYTRYFPYVPSDAIQATCASTSDTLYVDTQ